MFGHEEVLDELIRQETAKSNSNQTQIYCMSKDVKIYHL